MIRSGRGVENVPAGTRDGRAGREVLLRLAAAPLPVRFVRVWMTRGSGTAPPGAADVRDGLGYAIREIGVGVDRRRGHFQDWVQHAPDGKRQTPIYASSTDPWHRADDRDPNVEQPGFDRVFRQRPDAWPAAAHARRRAVRHARKCRRRTAVPAAARLPCPQMELGEEPDGQYITPEDYGALYVQWADALHRVDPTLNWAGRAFKPPLTAGVAWPDARGNRSWMGRFLRYLKARGHLQDFTFFSFEWYPFDDVCAPHRAAACWRSRRCWLERIWPGCSEKDCRRIFPAHHRIWLLGVRRAGGDGHARCAAQRRHRRAVSDSGRRPRLSLRPGAERRRSMKFRDCDTWGNLALFLSDDDRHIRCPLADLLWRAPADPAVGAAGARLPPQVYRAVSRPQPIWVALGNMPTPCIGPDGQWAVMLLNKDPRHAQPIRVQFQNVRTKAVSSWRGPVDVYQYSSAQYVWHPERQRGYPAPDLPPSHRRRHLTTLRLPPFSLTVVRGTVTVG